MPHHNVKKSNLRKGALKFYHQHLMTSTATVPCLISTANASAVTFFAAAAAAASIATDMLCSEDAYLDDKPQHEMKMKDAHATGTGLMNSCGTLFGRLTVSALLQGTYAFDFSLMPFFSSAG